MAIKSKILNVRTTEQEYDEIKKFAAFHGISMTDFVLESVYERMADLEDIQAVREYEKEKSESGVDTVSWEKVQADLGI